MQILLMLRQCRNSNIILHFRWKARSKIIRLSGRANDIASLIATPSIIMEKVAATLLLGKLISRINVPYNLNYWVVFYARTVLYLTSAQQERCGSIGNSDETAATPSRDQAFYLDTANPATCGGNITSWRVCYYGPDSIDRIGSYWATYAVYRRMGSGSSSYQLHACI